MRLSPLLPVLCFALTAPLFAQVPKEQVPQMQNVEPKNGKIGSVLRATGLHLGKTKVEEVYLTDHTFDMMVKVLDQTDNSIQFRIPPSVKPGKLQLLVKTAGKEPVLLEEPVYITVEEEKDTSAEVASATPSSGATPER
jgi:hypothetical protein